MPCTWTFRTFQELSNEELYELLRLRSEVFVVEQQCIFPDMDGKDPQCWHLLGYEAGKLVAYARLLPPQVSYAELSIGRVVTAPSVRRSGLGRQLMQQSIAVLSILFGPQPIRIGAQLYLKDFYESFGFVQQGDGYLEDGIPHIEMLRP